MAYTWQKQYIQALGLHLKELRLSKKITQEALSKKSGISVSQISRMERGERGATLTTLRDLAIGLKVHPSVLLDFKFEIERTEGKPYWKKKEPLN